MVEIDTVHYIQKTYLESSWFFFFFNFKSEQIATDLFSNKTDF